LKPFNTQAHTPKHNVLHHPYDVKEEEAEKLMDMTESFYLLELEYLVTALVPSETACLASSPGRMSRTDVWISRDEMVDFLLYAASLEASVATRSKISGRD
jgi:hypothetical protein